jgi:DNA repair protein RadD
MTFRLRDYQEVMIGDTRLALRKHRAVLLRAPTGSGKTAIASYMTGGARNKGLRAWFMCHRDFLLEQTHRAYETVGIEHSYIAAGMPVNYHHSIQVCSVSTVARRLDKLTPPDLFIWDEAHHIAATTWKTIRDWGSGAKHIGLSATPARLDGKGLRGAFSEIVHGPDTGWLIEHGYLSKYRAFAPSRPDLKGVHTVAGDYNKHETAEIMDTSEIIGDMVRHYRSKANGKRIIYFAVSVEHSKHIAATFNASGIPALHLDGSSTTQERIAAAARFAEGSIKVLSNVDLFGEGYDLSAQANCDVTVEAVGLARPTKSLALHLQQVGRALRPKNDPAIILDHAGNLLRHGLPDDDREWTLDGVVRSKNSAGGPPVRQCPTCFGVHSAAKATCPYCGHVYETEGRSVDEVAGDLAELDVEQLRAARKAEQAKCRTLNDLIDLAKRRGYKNPEKWAGFIWTAKTRWTAKRFQDQWAAYRRD